MFYRERDENEKQETVEHKWFAMINGCEKKVLCAEICIVTYATHSTCRYLDQIKQKIVTFACCKKALLKSFYTALKLRLTARLMLVYKFDYKTMI